jgi:hypothetical protein
VRLGVAEGQGIGDVPRRGVHAKNLPERPEVGAGASGSVRPSSYD